MTVFGPMFRRSQLHDPVAEAIAAWADEYLAEAEQQAGLDRDYLQRPLSIVPGPRWDRHYPEEALPHIGVVSKGSLPGARREGDGGVSGPWDLGISIRLTAPNQDLAIRNVDIYAAAIRTLVLQRRPTGCRDIAYVNDSYDDDPPEAARTLAGVRLYFVAWMADLANVYGGPASGSEPRSDTTDPYPDWPHPETVEVTWAPEDPQ